MVLIQTQSTPQERAECPRCKNREGIRDGGPTGRGQRAYDIMSDSFGLCRCPRCGLKAGWIEFHKAKQDEAAFLSEPKTQK